MKKNYKLMAILIAVFAFATFVNAQTWDAPVYKSEVPVSGTSYYIYNVGLQGFLNRGGDWAAEAVVSGIPNQNASANINKWTCLDASGVWTFQYNNNGTNIANNYLFQIDDGGGWIFTDNSTNNTWNIAETDATNHIFAIQVDNTKAYYNAANYLGALSASRMSNKGTCNSVRYNVPSGDSYTSWKFVSQASYELYQAKLLLSKYMNYAKLKGGIDLTSYIATYNADVTVDINTAATTLLGVLAPTDVTVSILNPSFETNSFVNWTNSGFALQSNNPGWTKDGTYYAEKWTGSNGNLGTATLTQTVTGLTNGLYGLVATSHAIQQGGSNPLHTGAFVTAGTSSTEVYVGKDYAVDFVPVIDGNLTIGYKLQLPIACNWVGFDNFKLYYYGPMAVPSMVASETSLFFSSSTTSTKGFNISGANLSGNIAITAPTGITLTGTNLVNNGGGSYTILAANANAVNAITATWDGLASFSGVNITVTESEVPTVNIAVEASADALCYTPTYPSRTNLISDPFMNSLSSYGGWGNTSITTDPEMVYCGSRSGFINGTAVCYPASGSIDANIAWQPNKSYLIKAMVKAVNGTLNIGVSNETNITGVKDFVVPQSDTWVEFSQLITTGPAATAGLCFFNGCGASTGYIGYIDNWEIYDVSDIVSGTENAKLNQFKVYNVNKGIATEFNLDLASEVEFVVFNMQGSRIATQLSSCEAGNNVKIINANLPSGVYIVQMTVNGKLFTGKLVK